MKTRKVGLVCLISMFSLIVIGCRRSETPWKGTIEKAGGVTVVKNPKEPLSKGGAGVFALDKDLVIGVKEGPAEYTFSQIQDVDVDAEGNIYVLDQRETQVKVFDATGLYLRTIGRKGQGPGEIQMPVLVQVTKQGELLVYDYALSRANFYSLEGVFIRQGSPRRPLMPIAMDSRGSLVGYEILAPPPIGGKLLKRYDPDLLQAKQIAQDEQGQPKTFDIGKPAIYACLGPHDELVWGHSEKYVLNSVDPAGETVRVVQRDYDPVSITLPDRTEYEERYAEPVRHGMSIKFREHYPAFCGLSVDEEGRLFVKTYERADGESRRNVFDIYDPEGRYLVKTVIMADLNERSAWKNNKLYTIEMDELGFPTIVRYRVAWNQ